MSDREGKCTKRGKITFIRKKYAEMEVALIVTEEFDGDETAANQLAEPTDLKDEDDNEDRDPTVNTQILLDSTIGLLGFYDEWGME